MMHAITASRARAILRSRWFPLTARIVVVGVVLIAIVAYVGTGPFVHGLLSLDVPTIVAAAGFAAVATAAAAWRWRVIAGRLGVGLLWSTAVRMYYQSQFLNTVLPGGVVGDVQRAVDHGRQAESVGMATRAVAVERAVGQVVQLALAVVVLVCFGAEFEGYLLPAIGIGLVVLVAAVLAAATMSERFRRALRREAAELRTGLGTPAVSAQVVAASVVVVCCHLATFAIAAAAVGVRVPPVQLLTLAIVVLLASSIPVNVGGWGPREGVAGWAFAVAGLGAAAGVSSATLFGVLAIISVAPGVIVTRLASLISRRNNRDRHPLCDAELRHLPRWVPRHGPAAAARPLERSGLRPGG